MSGILLASGGLDSTTLAYWMVENEIDFSPLFINYGQHCFDTEKNTLIQVLPASVGNKLKIIDVSDIYKNSNSRLINEADLWRDDISYENLYLPYRTLMLLSLACAYAQANGFTAVYAGFINSNHALEIDCSAAFFDKLADILSGYGGIKLIMPFRNMSKYDVVKIGIELKAPIGKTFSCQASSDIPCGACPNCVDRLDALKRACNTN